MKISEATTEQLLAMHSQLEEQVQECKVQQDQISKELGFRDALEIRSKALAGMSKEEIERVVSMSQSVAAGGVPSAEAVGKVG